MQPIESSGMDIIQRNFFRILCSGAFGTQSSLEPMSAFKWRRLIQMVEAQQVMPIFTNGIARHSMDEGLNLPESIITDIKAKQEERKTLTARIPKTVRLSNSLLNRRLKSLIYNELHSIDTSIEALDLLKLIVSNSETMFTRGMNLGGIITMGEYLRTRGNKVRWQSYKAMYSSPSLALKKTRYPLSRRLTLMLIDSHYAVFQTWQGTLRMNGTSNKTLQGLFKTTTQCSNATYAAVFATLDMHPSRRQVTSFATSLEAFLK